MTSQMPLVAAPAFAWLPTGRSLPHASWLRRHRQIRALIWIHAAVLPLIGIARGEPAGHAVAEGAVLAVLALGSGAPWMSKALKSMVATVGLVTSSAILTHITGGLIESHFHFFVMVVVVSLYQSWQPFLLALAYVVVHHGLAGILPSAVFNHPAALANPWKWAVVHGAFILGQSAACLVTWRVNEDALDAERSARANLERAHADLAEAQALSNLGSWDWDLASGVIRWSDEMCRIAGIDPRGFTPKLDSFLNLVHPDDRFRVAAIIDAATRKPCGLDYESRIVDARGATRDVHVRGEVEIAHGAVVRMIGTFQDITDRKLLEREIVHRAFHDPLTGLGNRALFLDRVDHALSVRARSAAPLALLFLDLDDFKTVNDSLGHATGDDVLVAVGRRLRQAVRPSDTVARLGGDEFAMLLEDTDLAGAREVAARVEGLLADPVVLDGRQFAVPASIGIAVAANGTQASELLRDADIAMYAAKREGKGHCRVFTTDMLSSVITRMELKAELAHALENGELVLHYQPITDLDTGRVESVEALVRWNHPLRGLIPPLDFISLAEETGLIVALGAWVTRQAVGDVKLLHERLGRSVAVSVNLSPQQLSSDVAGMVRSVLADAGVDPGCLILEITESCMMGHEEAVDAQLGELRALGVRIAIDDFGTGYSSLGYLRRLPIDILKIDRTFVACIADGVEASALAHSIIKLGRIFGLRIVAEGIETEAQAAVLREFGCDAGQGYLFLRPLELDALAVYLAATARRPLTSVA